MRHIMIGALALFSSGAALAQEMVGNPAAGEKIFAGQCSGCHVVQNEAGDDLAPLSTNPMNHSRMNLYGIAGHVPGSLPDTFYSSLMRSFGKNGAVWEEANFVAYILDPPGFLHQATGQGGPAAMEAWIHDEQEAHDVWAYLAGFSP